MRATQAPHFAVSAVPGSAHRVFARRVGALRFTLCAAPHYIEQQGLPETAEDVARHHQIGFVLASTGRVRPVTLLRDGRKVESDVPARFVTTDNATALSAGLDGMGIIVLAEFVACHYLTSGALSLVAEIWGHPQSDPVCISSVASRTFET